MNKTHGGEVWDYEALPVDFSANINPLGPSEKALRTIEPWKVGYYPPADPKKLKAILGEYAGVSAENVVIGSGSVELIKDFCTLFLSKSDNVVVPHPTFSEYERYSTLSGAELKTVLPAIGIRHDVEEIIKAADENTRIIFLCRPNNPTGHSLDEKDVWKLLDFTSDKGIYLFLDEVFIEFSDHASFSNEAARLHNLFVLRSLTKFFAIPGLRIGYGIGGTEIIEKLEGVRTPWNINIFAHDAAAASVQDHRYIENTRKFIQSEKSFLRTKLEETDINVYDSDANFFLIQHNWNSKQVKRALLKKGLLVRDCSSFPGLDTRFLRVCVRRRAENETLIRELDNLVSNPIRSRDCEYYPCHFEGQDCTYCFCPFYPCEDEAKGEYIIGRKGSRVWTCKNCSDIHQAETVERIHQNLKGINVDDMGAVYRKELKERLLISSRR